MFKCEKLGNSRIVNVDLWGNKFWIITDPIGKSSVIQYLCPFCHSEPIDSIWSENRVLNCAMKEINPEYAQICDQCQFILSYDHESKNEREFIGHLKDIFINYEHNFDWIAYNKHKKSMNLWE